MWRARSRAAIAGANTDSAAENIAAGTKTWADTLRIWKASPGHNANLLRAGADSLGVAVAYNENTRYKVYWAMVIGRKDARRRTAASGYSWGSRMRLPGQTRDDQERSTAGSSGSSVGTLLMRAISPLRNLLP